MSRPRCIRALFPALAAIALLSGCGGGTESVPLEVELVRSGQEIIARRGSAPAARPTVSRALLDSLDEAVLEVTLERKDLLAYLTVSATRADATPGRVTVWRTEDNVSLALRNGLLIATRGLGGDLLSSAVQVAGNRAGPAAGGAQVQIIRSLDNRQVRLPMACELVDLGPETIEVIERRHATRHLQHRCTGGGGRIVNDYWVDGTAGLVRQSRQWAGPHIGYMRFRRLVD